MSNRTRHNSSTPRNAYLIGLALPSNLGHAELGALILARHQADVTWCAAGMATDTAREIVAAVEANPFAYDPSILTIAINVIAHQTGVVVTPAYKDMK